MMRDDVLVLQPACTVRLDLACGVFFLGGFFVRTRNDDVAHIVLKPSDGVMTEKKRRE